MPCHPSEILPIRLIAAPEEARKKREAFYGIFDQSLPLVELILGF